MGWPRHKVKDLTALPVMAMQQWHHSNKKEYDMLGIILWIIFGALAGWIASKIMHTDHEQGPIMNVIVGIVGAMIGGFLVRVLGGSGITGFNIYSLLVAVVGAVILLAIFRAVSGRTSHSHL
jgi:uncharacterized membrane protein YeaQ/YmgE (transglycosylase-associated protein family)